MEPLAPSRARFNVLYFGIAIAVIQYIDRVCISWAMPEIRESLKLVGKEHDDAVGYIFGAFTVAYALFEIPTGWLGDRFGTRKTLVRVVLWWSFFTAATGWVMGLTSLIIVRFLFGMGEAGCFPNLTRAFSTWLPPGEKSRAQSTLWLCARWGGALTPLLVVAVLGVMSWRAAFGLFASLGVLWAVFFYRWFRDEPREHPSVNQAERALLASNPAVARHDHVPWKSFVSSRTTWLLWAQYFFFSYCWYFYVTWLSKYLKDSYGSTWTKLGLAMLGGVPLFAGGFGNLLAGFLMPRLARWTGDLGRSRRILAFTGFALAGVAFLFPAHHMASPLIVMVAMGLASFFGDLSMPSSWSACMDIGGKFSGTYSGSMNMMGNLGGALGPILIGHLLVWSNQNWGLIFNISAGAYFVAAVCWLLIDPVTPLDRSKDEPAPASAPAA
ncbi:MAG TPA: MFS transporter [Planctomycetota bacterium]|nr:MFS transporter [Planctomycetota bacterium]